MPGAEEHRLAFDHMAKGAAGDDAVAHQPEFVRVHLRLAIEPAGMPADRDDGFAVKGDQLAAGELGKPARFDVVRAVGNARLAQYLDRLAANARDLLQQVENILRRYGGDTRHIVFPSACLRLNRWIR